MDDLITGFVAVAVSCILMVDLVSQLRITELRKKLDEIAAKLDKK